MAPWLDVAFLAIDEGHEIEGGFVSVKLTVKLQEALNPALSLVVQFTILAPIGNLEQDAGVHVVVTEPELSDVEGEKQ